MKKRMGLVLVVVIGLMASAHAELTCREQLYQANGGLEIAIKKEEQVVYMKQAASAVDCYQTTYGVRAPPSGSLHLFYHSRPENPGSVTGPWTTVGYSLYVRQTEVLPALEYVFDARWNLLAGIEVGSGGKIDWVCEGI